MLSRVNRQSSHWKRQLSHMVSPPSAFKLRTYAIRKLIRLGMPYPTNYDTAKSVESIIRSGNVTPATIALISGRIHIGLTDAVLQQISDPEWQSVKVSRRDLAPVLSQWANGGTTVAGTMYIAQSVGIPLFVTGGIGGVHRGAESSTSVQRTLIARPCFKVSRRRVMLVHLY